MTSSFEFEIHTKFSQNGKFVIYPKRNNKLKFLPNWLSKYGYLLKKEEQNNLPKIYRKFNQGTIVKVDFGARIGSEMSLEHFGIVLTKNDNKYKRNIIVVPLSSKKHEGYLPLGKELFKQALILVKRRIDDINHRSKTLVRQITNIPSNLHFEFNNEEVEYLNKISNIYEMPKWVNIDILEFKNSYHYKLYEKIIHNNDYYKFDNIVNFVLTVEKVSKKIDDLNNHLEQLKDETNLLTKLENKLNKYNKETYADVGNITTVSKLRVSKFSKYNLSGNITFNENIINKIKDRLNDFI